MMEASPDRPDIGAIKSLLAGQPPADVASAHNLPEDLVHQWMDQLGIAKQPEGNASGKPKGRSVQPEIDRLRDEVTKLKRERNLLARKGPGKDSEFSNRNEILDATERLMIRDGYATLSTRKIAKEAGVTPALVNYYFKSRNDLLLAAMQRKKQSHTSGVAAALSAENPVLALWKFYRTKEISSLELEFMASVTHENSVGEMMGRDIEEARVNQIEVIADYLDTLGIPREKCNPAILIMIVTGMARSLVIEEILGVTCGHEEVKDFLENCFSNVLSK